MKEDSSFVAIGKSSQLFAICMPCIIRTESFRTFVTIMYIALSC